MYVREVGGQKLTLQVSGKLWMRSLVMSDVETGTEWAHLLGRAMAGKLSGKRLKPIITDMVTWSVWKEQHPETTVLNMSPTSRNYTREFYRNPSNFVFGFDADGRAWTLSMDRLIKHPLNEFQIANLPLLATFDNDGAVTHLYDRRLDGDVLNFEQHNEQIMTDTQTGSRWEMLNGQCISGKHKGAMLKQRVGIMSLRRAWQNFHPESTEIDFSTVEQQR